MEYLNDNIRLIRKLARKTQPQFALLFDGVSIDMQKSYESGRAVPDLVYMQRLSDFAGVSQKKLVGKQLRIEEITFAKKVEKGEKGERKEHGAVQHDPTIREILTVLAEAFIKQTEILERIEGKMTQHMALSMMIEKVLSLDDRTKNIDANLSEALGGLEKISLVQNEGLATSLKEYRKLNDRILALAKDKRLGGNVASS